jgi:hypothetical protein
MVKRTALINWMVRGGIVQQERIKASANDKIRPA